MSPKPGCPVQPTNLPRQQRNEPPTVGGSLLQVLGVGWEKDKECIVFRERFFECPRINSIDSLAVRLIFKHLPQIAVLTASGFQIKKQILN